MSVKQKKKKGLRVLMALASLAMMTGFVVLFIAASKDRSQAVCRGVAIDIRGPGPLFVDRNAISASITGNKKLDPVGRKLEQLNMPRLESSVRTFPWVKEVELYVDNTGMLRIRISQCVPVARIYTVSGNTFYVDGSGKHLPVTGSFAADLPVFTGFPTDMARPDSADSVLFCQVVAISRFLSGSPFWKAQVSQVNILPGGHFEVIPTVGNALIELGSGDRIAEKFGKLMEFYRGALNQVGWGWYDTLNLAYEGQVVATRKKGGNPVVDSLMTSDSYGNAVSGALTPADVPPPVEETSEEKQPKAFYHGLK